MITNQAILFAIFLLNGVIIGFLFDIFRILRKSFKTSDIVTYIEDILFWIFTGIIILYSIFTFNNGEIRLFMIIAVIIGSGIYLLYISSYVIKINVTIILFCKKIIHKIFSILIFPIKIILTFLRKILIKPVDFIILNIRKTFKTIFNKNTKNNTKIIKKDKKSYFLKIFSKNKKDFWKKSRKIIL